MAIDRRATAAQPPWTIARRERRSLRELSGRFAAVPAARCARRSRRSTRFARTADDIADEGDATAGERLRRPGRLPRRPARRRRRRRRRRRAGRRCSSRWPRRSRATRLPLDAARPTCSSAFVQDVTEPALRRPRRRCSTTAAARPTRSAGCCCICTASTTPTRWRRSDAICTALQLANFWQDLGVDTRARPPLPARTPTAAATASIRRRAAAPAATRRPLRALVADVVAWARDADARRRAAGARACPAAPAGSCASSCRAACASSSRSTRSTARRLLHAPDAAAGATRRCSPGARCACARAHGAHAAARGAAHDARAVRPGQGRRAAARASTTPSCSCRRRGAPRSPPSMPSAARSTTSSTRSRDPGVAATKLAWWRRRGRGELRRPAEPPGDAGADAAHRRLRHRADAPARGDRRLPDGPGPDALPRLRRPGALLPPGRRRRRRGRGEHLRPHRARRPSPTRTSSAWRCSSPTSSATSATTRGAAASTCRWTSCKQFDVKAQRAARARGYSERFTALMHFQAERAHRCYDEALALLPGRPARAEARADDGQHLPHAAARDRGRRLPGAAPAHLADAAAQALDRDAHATGAGARRHGAAARRGRRRLGRPRRRASRRRAAARRSRCSRWRRTLGGRARAVDADGDWRSTTASTS